MKVFFAVLVVLSGLLQAPEASANSKIIDVVSGKVVAILDGDTLDVLTDDRKQVRVRIGAIDAPEKAQPFGTRAREILGRIVAGERVLVHVYKLDRHESKYGKRRIGNVYVKDVDVGLEMVRMGYAWHYKAYEHEQSDHDRHIYSARQAQAQHQKLGLWADPNPTPPWDWRKRGN